MNAPYTGQAELGNGRLATNGKALPGKDAGVTDQPAPRFATGSFRCIMQEFLAFLRRPQVLAPQGWRGGGFRHWAIMTALLVLVLIGIMLPFLTLWQKAFALPSPDAFRGIDKQWLVPLTVLLAPTVEELLFRGWQNGRAASLWLMVCAAAGIGILVLITTADKALLAAGGLLAAVVAAPIGWFILRRRPAPLRWFARLFPWIFYIVAVMFGLVHLTNYPSFSLLAVPLVLPQIWAGLVLGYLRQRIGLPQAILAHIVANACSVTLALTTGGL